MAKKFKSIKGGKDKSVAKTVEAPAKAAKKTTKKEGTRKFSGKTTGLGVTAFQNQLMAKNFKAKLTDEQLADAMRREFPEAVPYVTGHVVGIRSAWNNGKRAGQDNVAPDKKLPRFNADGTSTVETRGAKGAAKKAAKKAAKDAAPVASKAVKKVAKKAAPAPEPEDVDEDLDESEDESEEE